MNIKQYFPLLGKKEKGGKKKSKSFLEDSHYRKFILKEASELQEGINSK